MEVTVEHLGALQFEIKARQQRSSAISRRKTVAMTKG